MALDNFQPYLFVSAGEQSNKYLTPVISPNGIASFQAQRAQSINGLTVRIDPIQEGTGDPSPTNIRPISGRTGLTVTAAGKNLFDGVFSQQNPSQIQSAALTLPAGTYTYSQKYNGTPTWGVYVQRPDNTEIAKAYNANKVTFTLSQEESVIIRVYYGNGITPANITEAQIEIGSTATPYTPYVAPTTYPVTWQTEAGIVYGGTLDVVSGVLTVDRAMVKFSDKSWTVAASRFYCEIADTKEPQTQGLDFVCSAFSRANVSDYAIMPDNTAMLCPRNFSATRKLFVVRSDAYTSADAFLAAMGDQTLVYPLAAPQTYNITPTEIKTLAGFNQVYSDAGPVIDIKF